MNRTDAYWIAAFPVLLALGIVTIPVVADYADHGMAAEAARQSARWYWGHLITAVAFGVAVVAAVALRSWVHAVAPGRRVGTLAVPLIAVGAVLHAMGLGADGIAPLANLAGGGMPETYFDGGGTRLTGVFVAGAAAFTVGWISLFVDAGQSGALRGAARWLVVAGMVAFGGAEAIPSGWGLYLVAAVALCLWLPLGVLAGRREGADP